MRSASQAKENAVCDYLATTHAGEHVHVFIDANVGNIPAGIWEWDNELQRHSKKTLSDLRGDWENDDDVRGYVSLLPKVSVPESRIPTFVKESALFWHRLAQKTPQKVLIAA
jgi:hypothetical protein